MTNLCQYKDLFGAPGTGNHAIRFGGVAVIDVLVTLLAAFIIARYTRYSFGGTALVLFVLGILAHRLFCVRTAVDRVLFPQ